MVLRNWIQVGVLGSILATVLAGGYHLHELNRERAVEQFQQLEQHTANEIASLLQIELTGAARTLQAVAQTAPGADAHTLNDLVDRQQRCDEVPCFTAATLYGADGQTMATSRRQVDLAPADVADTLAWAAEPSHALTARTLISSPQPPSLILLTPTHNRPPESPEAAAPPRAVLTAKIELDALFAQQERNPGSEWHGYEVLVLKTDGTVVFHSQHPEMRLNNVYRRTARCFTCHESFDHIERMLAMQRGVLEYSARGVDQIAAVSPLTFEGERWIVGLKVPRDHVTAMLSAELTQGLAGTSLIVVLVVVAGVIAWRDNNRRFKAEAAAVQKAQLETSHAQLTALNARLETAAHEWRATADTIDAGLIVLEPGGTIWRMNVAAASILPDALGAWLGRPSSQLAEHPPWSTALALAHDAVEHGRVMTGRAEDTRSGRTWDLWCRPLRGAHARPAVVVLARDITEIIRLQESVRRTETMAALGSVVVGVAHEVRNPLFAISSLVDAWSVQSHRDPRPFVDALRGEVERLRTLMVELLEYGRPAKTTLERRRLRPVVEGAIRSCMHHAMARRVRVVAVDGTDADVFIDARRLERVFINIIQNAVQHAPAESEVHVEVIAPAGGDASRLEVRVIDRGPGFTTEDLPRVFTPFFSRRAGGFGLGLAISERIVTEHQGRVTAANNPAGGAVITVSLPIIQAHPAAGGAREVEVSC